MGARLGNVLLTLGTVLSAIAAASSHKAGRSVDLAAESAFPGEYVLHAVEGTSEAGAALDAALVARLRAAGHETIQVRTPPLPTETLPGDDVGGLTGRVLDADVVLSTEPRSLPAGTQLESRQLRELRDGGIEHIRVEGEPEPVEVGAPGTFGRVGSVLTQDVTFDLPERILAGAFLSEDRARAIREAHVGEVTVRIPKEFRLRDWNQLWVFALGIAAMLAGIFMKRSALRAEAVADAAGGGSGALGVLRTRLENVVRDIAALAEDAEGLETDEIHRRLDPILTGDCYELVEGRQRVANAFGTTVFADVMAAFSSGERRLNRAWSASVDGYPEEARVCLREALPFLRAALAAFPERG